MLSNSRVSNSDRCETRACVRVHVRREHALRCMNETLFYYCCYCRGATYGSKTTDRGENRNNANINHSGPVVMSKPPDEIDGYRRVVPGDRRVSVMVVARLLRENRAEVQGNEDRQRISIDFAADDNNRQVGYVHTRPDRYPHTHTHRIRRSSCICGKIGCENSIEFFPKIFVTRYAIVTVSKKELFSRNRTKQILLRSCVHSCGTHLV